MNENCNDCHHRNTTCTFLYTQKSKTIAKLFLHKKPYTLFYGIFMKFFKLAFIYKKHDTLRYVTFFIQKDCHFAKSKTICNTFLYAKIRHFALRGFIDFLKLRREGGGHFVMQKNYALCVTFLYKKNNALSVFALYKKSLTLCVTS